MLRAYGHRGTNRPGVKFTTAWMQSAEPESGGETAWHAVMRRWLYLWFQQWVAAGPRWLFRIFGVDPVPLLIVPDGAGFGIIASDSGRQVGRLAGEGGVAARAPAPIMRHAGPVWLLADPERVLSRRISVPATAVGDLRAILGFEIERVTPFEQTEVYFGYRLLPALDGHTAERDVELVAVQRSDIDPLIDNLFSEGVRVDGAVHFQDIASPPTLLPLANRPDEIQRQSYVIGAMALSLSALILLVVILWLPHASLDRQLASMEAAVAKQRPAVDALLAERNQRNQTDAGKQQLLQERAAAPAVTDILERVTRILPDDTWLTGLRYVQGFVDIDGTTRSASGLVPLLEADPLISRVEFAASVTTEPISRRERFQFRLILADAGR